VPRRPDPAAFPLDLAQSLPGADSGETDFALPPYRRRQIYRWIWRGLARSFDDMTDLPQSLREELGRRFTLYGSAVRRRLADTGGTVKLGLELEDGAAIEAVLLTGGRNRKTACLSTQAGCPLGCVFCKTGSLGFKRNLSGREIAEQFLHLARAAREDGARTASHNGDSRGKPPVGNIVVMGMGEPLLNLPALREALAGIREGAGISPRRVTVSTSGVAAGIRDLAGNGPPVELALSLPSAREETRKKLMPGAAGTGLEALRGALLYYQRERGRRITLETVLLGGVNTGPEDAAALLTFARGLFTVVNIIPWNPVPGLSLDGRPLREPDTAETAAFVRALEAGGLNVTRRREKGRGVAGACGQLGGLSKEDTE
jgi:23S rRNA (adenine2503-C2)-methyltransferase